MGGDDSISLRSDAIDAIRNIKQGEGKCIIAASQASQEAYVLREKHHSMFTYYLLQGLRGDIGAIDEQGNVTIDTLFNYIRDRIMSLPRERRSKQKPIKKAEVSGTIILARYPEKEKVTRIDVIVDRGNNHLEKKEFEEAIKCYDEALQLRPDDNKTWYKKGVAYGELKMYQEGIKCIRTALSLIT